MILYKKFIKPAISFLRCSRLLVKSDRINALRKQYDAFLEQDKKRKERNDFILSKLDKMRYSSATVALRAPPTLYRSQQTGLYNKGNEIEKSAKYDQYLSSPMQQLPLKVPKKHLDDSDILQEITKKYILIPKRRSMFVNEYPDTIKPVMVSDSDWKSKYDILNQLNQSEKAEREEKNITPINEKNLFKNIDSTISDPYYEPIVSNDVSDIAVRQECRLVHDIDKKPEKEVIYIETNKLNHMENQDHVTTHNVPSEKNYDKNITQNLSPGVINDLECKMKTMIVDKELPESMNFNSSPENVEQQSDSNINRPISNKLEYSEIYSNSNQNGNEQLLGTLDQSYTQGSAVSAITSVVASHKNNLNAVQEIKTPQSVVKEGTNENNIVTAGEFKQDEDIEYPIEIINVQDFTPNENVDLQDGVNINPQFDHENSILPHDSQNEDIREESENIHVTGIEEFDAEQREMFYSEQPNENYEYDQTNPEDAYQEYPQNENYQQNEEYAYYEGVPADQTNPTEVNEFEETSQPYDQTYQEQYAAYDPVYVQQETYEQEPQQYEVHQEVDPDVQPEMEQLQNDQLNYQYQNVEHQLDTEQGYTENDTLQNTDTQLAQNSGNEELKNITNQNQALQNSEIQENIIQENSLNN